MLMSMNVKKARRIAGFAVLLVIFMGVTKGIVGYLAGSLALQADAVHTIADLLAILAAWFGLTLALRPASRKFPYGYYRAETLAALVASGAITYMGSSLLWEGIQRIQTPSTMERPWLTISMGFFSAVMAFFISRWENKAAHASNSQSLGATAAETRMDAVSSLMVLVSGVGALLGVHWLDGVVGVLIAIVIIWIGIKNISQAVLSLMDASVNPELEEKIKRRVSEANGVRNVEKVLLRRAGPFYFLDGHLRVPPSMEVVRGHEIAHRAQRTVREEFPQIEGIMFHIEPDRPEKPRLLLPLVEDAGLNSGISEHFGRAPFFLIARTGEDGAEDVEIIPNEMQDKEVRAGLAVINELLNDKAFDAVIVREIGEIAFHALRDHYIEVLRTSATTVEKALKEHANGQCKVLEEATHSSEKKLGDDR